MIRSWVQRAVDPDRVQMAATATLIEAAGVRHALDPEANRWRPGEPLKLLFAGYQGTRNTGADVRVEEMIRQVRTVLGEDNVEPSVLTIEPELSAGYFRGVRQVLLPPVFPKFLYDEVHRHHGVLACEGSMFKSKFANALSTMMAGSLGFAAVEGKLAVGYGAEAGKMDPPLAAFVRKHAKQALVLCRNEPSRRLLDGMGIRTRPGTDTAWTFEPASRERGEQVLREAGWDGRAPVLACCPINPFWWPAKPDVAKWVAHQFGGQFNEEHYKSLYFHTWSEAAEQRYGRYLDGLATAVGAFVREHGAFVVLVAMEQLDRRACDRVRERASLRMPVLGSDEHDMYTLVAALRACSFMVSSRYHALVTSMPAGVPSLGVTMDERIDNLLTDRGDADLVFGVEEDDLGERLIDGLRRLVRDEDAVRERTRRYVAAQLRRMGEMGIDFVDEVAHIHPELPRRDVPRTWEHHLPALSPSLQRLLEASGSGSPSARPALRGAAE